MKLAHHRTHERAVRRAFSLIEILIAVLVLALGLLGLGAVFPVAIADQRLGEDRTLGVSVSDAAIAQLRYVDYGSASAGLGGASYGVWEGWARDTLSMPAYNEGQWEVLPVDATTGAVTISPPNGPQSTQLNTIPLSDRMFPQTLTPQFVWDVAIHRRPNATTAWEDDAVELVVFVRRIDPRVKPADGRPLYQVLSGDGLPASLRQIPLSADENGLPRPGGEGPFYSTPQRLLVRVDYDPGRDAETASRDILEFRTPTSAVERSLTDSAMRVGQRLVDNLGNVYEVVGSERKDNRYRVRVSPPVPAYITEDDLRSPTGAATIREVIFTPERPAAVFVKRIDR